jgi:tRNA-specific 2-thiouridylase
MLDADRVDGRSVVWTAGAAPADRFDCAVQLRAHGMSSPARVTVDGSSVSATLDVPQQGIAAGQALVMYDGDVVLGSATITAARRADAQV